MHGCSGVGRLARQRRPVVVQHLVHSRVTAQLGHTDPEVERHAVILVASSQFGAELKPERALHRNDIDGDAVHLAPSRDRSRHDLAADEPGTDDHDARARCERCPQGSGVIKTAYDVPPGPGRRR